MNEMTWHDYRDYSARLMQSQLDEPLDSDDFEEGVDIAVKHESGRQSYYTVHADERAPGVIELWMTDGQETFVAEDALFAMSRCLTLCTMPVVYWDECANISDDEA